MVSKRRTQQPQPVFSDYDTETAAPVPGDLPAPLSTVSSLNDVVLRRHIPELEKIERVAPFTVVYHFSPDSQQWEKSGCEGTLFLCRLPGQRYTVIVLNRKSLDNFVIDLVSGDDVELTSEYIILQRTKEDGAPEIIGLWVYDTEGEQQSTKEVIGMAILEAANKAQLAQEDPEPEEEYEEYTAVQPVVPVAAPPVGRSLDVSTLFGRPQVQQETHVPVQVVNNGVSGQQLDLLKLFGKPPPQPAAHLPVGHDRQQQVLPPGMYHQHQNR